MATLTVEISARHIHLCQEHIDILFGKGHELTKKRDLSQPGEFLCEERVKVKGEKSAFESMAVLGPARPKTQVEISLTDARSIGVVAPIRESGDVAGSGSCEITGPNGSVTLGEGVIAAKRHLHLTPASAAEFGVADKQIVSVRVEGERALTFDEVVVRVRDTFNTCMHIDTDEANAASITGDVQGTVIAE